MSNQELKNAVSDWAPNNGLEGIDIKALIYAEDIEHNLGEKIKFEDSGYTITINGFACNNGNVLQVKNNKVTLDKNEKLMKCDNKYCKDCGFNICPFLAAAYLRNMRELRASVNEYVRNIKQKGIKSYAGILNDIPAYLFLDITDTQLEAALALVNKGYVNIRGKRSCGKIVVDYCSDICEINDTWNIKSYSEKDEISGDAITLKTNLDRVNFTDTCNVKNGVAKCGNTDCIINIAAYMDYIVRSNKFGEWRKNREEYLKSDQVNFIDNVANADVLQKVINESKNTRAHRLFCILQGNSGVGKTSFANNISKILARQNKTKTAIYMDISFDELDKILWEDHGKLSDNTLYVISDISDYVKSHDRSRVSQTLKSISIPKDNTYIIIRATESEVKKIFDFNGAAQMLYGNNIIEFKDLTAEESYNMMINYLNDNLKEEALKDGNYKKAYTEYITLNNSKIVFKNRKLAEYIASISNENNKLCIPSIVKTYNRSTSLDNILSEQLIGMEDIKHQLKVLERYCLFKRDAEMNGCKIPSSNMNMIFTGEYGTGKSTVANIISYFMYGTGVIREDKVVEVSGDNIITLDEAINSAEGGILYINKAENLFKNSKVITELTHAMEDNNNNIVVIFESEEADISKIILNYPEINSHIGYTFKFSNYGTEDLIKMTVCKLNKYGLDVDDSAKLKVRNIYEYFGNIENTCNSRFVDKIIQIILQKHACDVYGKNDIKVITDESIPGIGDILDMIPGSNTLSINGLRTTNKVILGYHMLGHAIVQHSVFPKTDFNKLVIALQGNNNLQNAEFNKVYNTDSRQSILNIIRCKLAGIAAEELVYGEHSSEGTDDIKECTDLVELMITKFGMSGHNITYRNKIDSDDMSEVDEILSKQLSMAMDILKTYNYKMDMMCQKLIKDGMLTGNDIINTIDK